MKRNIVATAVALPAANAREFCEGGILVVAALAAILLLNALPTAAEGVQPSPTTWSALMVGESHKRRQPAEPTLDGKAASAASAKVEPARRPASVRLPGNVAGCPQCTAVVLR